MSSFFHLRASSFFISFFFSVLFSRLFSRFFSFFFILCFFISYFRSYLLYSCILLSIIFPFFSFFLILYLDGNVILIITHGFPFLFFILIFCLFSFFLFFICFQLFISLILFILSVQFQLCIQIHSVYRLTDWLEHQTIWLFYIMRELRSINYVEILTCITDNMKVNENELWKKNVKMELMQKKTDNMNDGFLNREKKRDKK